MLRTLRARYGGNPLHLLALLASFCVAGYAAARFVPDNPVGIALWFVAAVIGHDLILLPLYTLADRSVAGLLRHRTRPLAWTPWHNHVRVPVSLSALLFAMTFPLILRLPSGFDEITGRSTAPYLGRWLLVTGLLFLGSAVILAVRLRRRSRSPAGAQQVLGEQGGAGLDAQPPAVSPGRQEGARGDEPERER